MLRLLNDKALLIEAILSYCAKNKYSLNKRGANDLTLVGIRTAKVKCTGFQDYIAALIYKVDGWDIEVFSATTEPINEYGKLPYNSLTLQTGFYKNLWRIGKYLFKSALVHRGDALVVDGFNKTFKLSKPKFKSFLHSFFIGEQIDAIHLIRAIKRADGTYAHYMDGDQVIEKADEYAKLLMLANIHKSLYNDSFNYVLLHENELIKV